MIKIKWSDGQIKIANVMASLVIYFILLSIVTMLVGHFLYNDRTAGFIPLRMLFAIYFTWTRRIKLFKPWTS